MFEIVEKKNLNKESVLFKIKAPAIAEKRKAGQFVVIIPHDKGERIPITIVDSDTENGTTTIVVQVVGKSTYHLSLLNEGDSIPHVVGPLGKATPLENFGHAVVIGGGVGTAEALPLAKELKKEGNRVTAILGARTRELLLFEDEMKKTGSQVMIATDDGSYGTKGFVTDVLKELLDKEKVDFVMAVGPVPMMKAVSDLTGGYKIKTLVSLNPIMVDATGLCGACRVHIGDETHFACVHGPEFDGHKVNFEELLKRQRMFKEKEKASYERFREEKERAS